MQAKSVFSVIWKNKNYKKKNGEIISFSGVRIKNAKEVKVMYDGSYCTQKSQGAIKNYTVEKTAPLFSKSYEYKCGLKQN